jgi:hypothetical protein
MLDMLTDWLDARETAIRAAYRAGYAPTPYALPLQWWQAQRLIAALYREHTTSDAPPLDYGRPVPPSAEVAREAR